VVLCGVGLKGAVARTKHDDVSTAGSEQRERPKRATSRASRRDWGFGGRHLISEIYLTLR